MSHGWHNLMMTAYDDALDCTVGNPSERSICSDRSVVGISPPTALPYNSQQYQSAITLVGVCHMGGTRLQRS